MSKFKVGELVKVRDDLQVGKFYGTLLMLDSMAKLRGMKSIIESADPSYQNPKGCTGAIAYSLLGISHHWSAEMLEKVEREYAKYKPMEIEVEHVVSDNLEKYVKLIAIQGGYARNQLPEQYLNQYPHFVVQDGTIYLEYIRWIDVIKTSWKLGEGISPSEFNEFISHTREAGKRLYYIKRELKEQAKHWQGTDKFEI